MPHDPRPYQAAAIDTLRTNVRRGVRKQLLVAPTGAGKTTIAALVMDGAIRRSSAVFFLAHRKELITQCSERLDDQGIDHGVLQANHWRFRPHLPVQVISVLTLRSRLSRWAASTNGYKAAKEDEDAEAWARWIADNHARGNFPLGMPCDLFIVDEAHRSMAASYTYCFDFWPSAPIIGLTATPWRRDNQPLGKLYDRSVVAAKPSDLIARGYLVKPKVYAPFVPDLSAVATRGGDYDLDALEDLMDNPKVVGDLVDHWGKLVRGRDGEQTVCFAVNKRHSRAIRDKYRAAGVRADHLDEGTPDGERTAIIKRLRDGVTKVICNVGILTEGWDLPQLKCAQLARPTKSLALYIQMGGRVMRPFNGMEKIILDHAGNTLAHGFIHEDRDYSLTTKKKKQQRRTHDGPPVRLCEECYAMFMASARACPYCEWEPPRVEREVDEIDGELREFSEGDIERTRLSFWEQVEAYEEIHVDQRDHGHKDLWANITFKERHGIWPPQKVQNIAKERVARRLAKKENIV